jgi:hypothetical protein
VAATPRKCQGLRGLRSGASILLERVFCLLTPVLCLSSRARPALFSLRGHTSSVSDQEAKVGSTESTTSKPRVVAPSQLLTKRGAGGKLPPGNNAVRHSSPPSRRSFPVSPEEGIVGTIGRLGMDFEFLHMRAAAGLMPLRGRVCPLTVD